MQRSTDSTRSPRSKRLEKVAAIGVLILGAIPFTIGLLIGAIVMFWTLGYHMGTRKLYEWMVKK